MPDRAALFPSRPGGPDHQTASDKATTGHPAGSETSMPGPHTAPSDTPTPRAALVALAAALDPREFAVTLTTRPGRRACLSVTSRHAAIGDDITADPAAYWWSWGERIGPLHDPSAAARKISAVLRAVPEPSHG
jgi:hypothetical protein